MAILFRTFSRSFERIDRFFNCLGQVIIQGINNIINIMVNFLINIRLAGNNGQRNKEDDNSSSSQGSQVSLKNVFKHLTLSCLLIDT